MSKSIYLFEDRPLRMEDYHLSEEVRSYIKLSTIDCTKEQLEEYVDRELSDASLVLFHKSYQFIDQTLKVDKVMDVCHKKNIRFAVFSGGLKSNLISEIEATLDSDDMYRNLPLFVDHMKQGEVYLSILIYGKNYILNPILRLLGKVNEIFWDAKDNDIIDDFDLEDVKELINNILQEKLSCVRTSLINSIEENEGKMTKAMLRNEIVRLLKEKMDNE